MRADEYDEGRSAIPPDIRADLAHRGIPVVDDRITEIDYDETHNATVRLDSSPSVAVDMLFAHPGQQAICTPA
jgi:hypothetical protein